MSDSLDNIELRSEEVQEILTRIPNWMIRWGSSLFLSLFIMVLGLSWFIKYPDVIETVAVITTEIPPQKEFAMVSAKFDSIYVQDSEIVTKNKVLAVLDNTANAEDIFYLQSILDTIDVKKNIFEFPLDSLPILFLGDVDQSFAAFENSYFQYKLNKNLDPFSNEEIANKISLSELQSRLTSLNAQYALHESEFNFKKNDLNRNKALYEKGVISKQEFENKQLEVLSAERNFKNLGVSISQIREAIGSARKTSKSTEISRTREETQLLKTAIQSFNQLKKAIKDWENTYVLKSEIDGKVSFLNYWNENQTVSQGDLVFTVIPSNNSNYLAKIKAPLQNSGKIEIGQSVNVKLHNYPETEFGMLSGKVENISQTLDKDDFYLVDVTLQKKLITSYKKEIEFKQEMRGTADIITEDLRLLERFFYQFKELLNR
ncbi:multidrug efflux pump subunit AcrA (membrane-fusion protein) [Saonia flava]|uniref:Multidrug efflux pump subunit AcrA (Membrane-fusion protein) n=1 Tax=Saonia flava TaxID=523696 RepID=A0A846QVL4_9FLAO|nr:HlyD family efflux transporter periplasmic adaptor subunit [Saonia flava]NJB70333.1 multidrug efflux pump subunit AcrA (membrane-fusion protein) [Saonia flava]